VNNYKSDIIFDSREESKQPEVYDRNYVITRLKSKHISVNKDFLEVGDILMQNGICMELKRGRDLTNSLMSNRLFEQLINMNQYEIPILVIITENKWRDFYRVKSNYIDKQFQGMLTTIILSFPKVRVVQVDNDEELVEFLVNLHTKLNKEGKSSRPTPKVRRAKNIGEEMENVFCSIRGVGVPLSKKLLHKFGSVEGVVNARIEDFSDIDKLGKKKSEKIYQILHEKYHKNNKNKRR